MAVGDTAKISDLSYIAVGKESTFGIYASATTAIEALSWTVKIDITSQKLETLHRNRGMNKRVQLDKVVAGSMESHLHSQESTLLVACGMGGELVTSSLTGAYTHSISAGNYDTTTAINSLSFNVRKGDTHTFRYTGGNPNVLTISAEVGSPVMVSAEMVFQDATQQSDDIGSSLTVSAITPFVYHEGNYIYAATENSLTTTVVEPIQSFELVINNNIVSDAPARRLGTQIPQVLPATTRNVELTINQRWDTTTNYNRFIQATIGSVRLQFVGASITSEHSHRLQIDMPKVYMNTPDPEIGGPGEVLQSEITFDVIVDDDNTTTGKDIGMTLINDIASY